jgi:hypothetical protein
MARTIDQIRASKLPSNMMQFAARGALQVPPAENIEILVYLALHNKVFGELARMTLAGWDEKACLAVVSDPQTHREMLDYFISPDNVRPRLLPALLENPSVPESKIVKLATTAMRDTVEIILKSKRALSLPAVVNVLKSNPYLRKEELELLRPKASDPVPQPSDPPPAQQPAAEVASAAPATPEALAAVSTPTPVAEGDHTAPSSDDHDEVVTGYIKEHAAAIAAEGEKPFLAIGGVVELLGQDYFPVVDSAEITAPPEPAASASSTAAKSVPVKSAAAPGKPSGDPKRENTLQKINRLDVKGRIQLALKGSKEERSILIRDGTKVVAFAVLEAPKLSDGEVEKFASQKNVLETVLRQITLKRRFMKNYIVVRNLCANPRTPLDLGLGLMKNLLIQDLKNISANKEVSETIRKLALKMYKQKLDEANKK